MELLVKNGNLNEIFISISIYFTRCSMYKIIKRNKVEKLVIFQFKIKSVKTAKEKIQKFTNKNEKCLRIINILIQNKRLKHIFKVCKIVHILQEHALVTAVAPFIILIQFLVGSNKMGNNNLILLG